MDTTKGCETKVVGKKHIFDFIQELISNIQQHMIFVSKWIYDICIQNNLIGIQALYCLHVAPGGGSNHGDPRYCQPC